MTKLHYYNNRWEYFQIGYYDKNVVPHHATISLVCSAHFNLQWISSSYWLNYLLKHAMKLKPNNLINLNIKNAKKLRFDMLSVIRL